MDLSSTAFAQGGDIPRKYTCEGDDIAPPLSWSDVPERTLSLALIVDDPDAPDPAAPTRTWVHYVLVDIPPGATNIPEGGGPLPKECRDGLNDWQRTGYGGPCPPVGRHRYFFKLYALDIRLPGLHRPAKADLERNAGSCARAGSTGRNVPEAQRRSPVRASVPQPGIWRAATE